MGDVLVQPNKQTKTPTPTNAPHLAPSMDEHKTLRDSGHRAVAQRVVIFLDIDGVLKPFGQDLGGRVDEETHIFPTSPLQALEFVLEQVPSAQLVLSSTWRVQESFIDIIRHGFRSHGGRRLAQADFADVTDPKLHTERQHEIYEWLSRHQGTIKAWIALDDEELLLGAMNQRYRSIFEDHVVKTDSHVGMTMDDARLAVALLQKQLGVAT